MRVLVTGGAGAIGRFVVEELCDRGHDVTVFDRVALDGAGLRIDDTDATSVTGDVTVPEDVADAVARTDTVVHLAALMPPACEADPRRANRVNVGGTLNVLEAAAGTETRVLCASSKAVYGAVMGAHAHPTYEPLSEDAPREPTNVYGATKLAVENYCRAYARNDDLDVAWFRFAATFGPGKGEAHGALSLLARLVENADAGKPVHLSGVDERNDWIYYPDIAAGVATAVEADALTHRAYHLGTGEAPTLRAFVDFVRKRRPDATIEAEGGLDFFDQSSPRYCRLDISRARTDLGYEPEYPVEAAINDFLERLEK